MTTIVCMRLFPILLGAGLALAQPSLTEKISAELQKSGAPSVSVAVVESGKVTLAQGFGKADISTGRPSDPSTRYAVGSISKQFTAAIVLLLQEQGKLSLDDRVSKYFPDLTRAAEISIRQLLSHTSGYEDYAPQDYNDSRMAEAKLLRKQCWTDGRRSRLISIQGLAGSTAIRIMSSSARSPKRLPAKD